MHKKKRTLVQMLLTALWLITAVGIIVFLIINGDPTLWQRGLPRLFKMFLLVGIASFIGAIIEYRAWTRFIAFIALPIIKFGRLPSISAVSFITALFSQNAANTLISNSCQEGNMSHRQMFISALCNSFPAMVSHSLRILFPLLSLIGMAGVWYYSFTFGVGAAMTALFLLISRVLTSREEKHNKQPEPENEIEDSTAASTIDKRIADRYSWNEVVKKSFKRTYRTLLRLLYITVPIYLLVIYMAKNHMFDFWNKIIPDSMQQILTPEIMTVFSARIGGLLNAAGIASEFLHQNKIETWQIVVAFMIGNIITNPIRTVRRNLPMTMGIFPKTDGLLIVLILQSLRMITTLIAIVLILSFHAGS